MSESKPTIDHSLTHLQSTHKDTLVELEKYKLLIDSVEDYAIFLLDPDGYIMSWNKGAERNKGYKPSEIIGRHFSTFYTQVDIDARKPERELEIASRLGRIEDEDWRVRKDGSRFWANVVITALYDTSHKLVGFGKVTRDLTERKQQEDELRRANGRLRKQQDELRRLSDSKDEFISLASHQLRTPATIVKQLLGLLLAGYCDVLTPAQTDIIQKANDSNERQISIVNSLLEVAQLDAGKVVLRKTPTDISRMVTDVIKEHRQVFEARRQTVELEIKQKQIEASVDPKYFRMVVENLIDNASKYTYESGKVTVCVEVRDGQVLITIADNGVGIAAEDITGLFTKFNRIPNELSQTVSGSGLGLYWVREIIMLHGGRISVESEPRKGTSFVVTLPAGEAHA